MTTTDTSATARLAVADIRQIMAAIRTRRLAQRMTQRQVATEVRVATSTYTLWEDGAAFPTSINLGRAARAVGMRLAVVDDGEAPS